MKRKTGKFIKNVKDYNQYLSSEYWLSLKKKFYKRRHRKCVICGLGIGLQVHHKQYFKRGVSILYRERLNELVCLCAECHNYYHRFNTGYKMKGRYINRIKYLLSAGLDMESAFKNCRGRIYKKTKFILGH